METGRREDLCLRDTAHGDTDDLRVRDLTLGDGRRLVNPDFGPRRTVHNSQVRLQPVQVDDKRWRIQFLNRGSHRFFDWTLHGAEAVGPLSGLSPKPRNAVKVEHLICRNDR